jgi:hypothetical protein
VKIKILFSVLTLLLAFSVVGGVYASKETSNSKTKLLKQRLAEFRETVDEEIAQSFEISLEDLKELDRQDVLSEEKYKDIAMKFMDLIIEQDEGDIIPSIYLDEENNELYLLEKKSDGTNVLHKFESGKSKMRSSSIDGEESNEWVEVITEEADGEIFDFEEVE